MTSLLIQISGQPPRQIELDHDAYTLGRAPTCDIILESQLVSRQHGTLKREGEVWVYTDLESRNGTLADGQRIQQVILKDGMRLQMGKDPARAAILTVQLGRVAENLETDKTVEAVETCPSCHAPLRSNAEACPACGFNHQSGAGRTLETVSVPFVPEFVLHDAAGSRQSHPLTKPEMRIGRASDNDIIIPSKLVSNHHLQVSNREGSVAITDLHSTNGTLVNGVRVTPGQSVRLQPGDVIRVGDLTGNSLQITYGSTTEEGLRTQSAGTLDLAKLARQPSMLIGRSSTCDMPIPHPSVSKQHAMVIRQGNTISIRDLGSTNGTFVNGARISHATLRDGDEIQIGPFRLVYSSIGQNLAGSRPLGHRLDGIQLVRQVKGGYTILNDVSVSIHSSEFVALVGGSGAGKSTLMKALNGYEPATSGQLLIDGQDLYSRLSMYRTEMGYVPQDDIIHRELPVRLALWYAAKLRLPDASEHEIKKAIDDALKAVEMTEHQHKRVKDLSGGQRKRVSIASELLAQPTLFFLDEPTSGLDPGLEKKMMYDLKRLADQGRTIVLVTHATTNIEQCDYVAFMAKGRLAYYGPPREAPPFFDAQDFADIYQKLTFEIDPGKGIQPPPELQTDYQEYASKSRGGSSSGKVSAGILWAERFRRSDTYQKHVAGKQANLGSARPGDLARLAAPVRPSRVSFLQQMYYLARRHIDLIRHDLRTLIILLVMLPLIGLLFGAVSGSWWLTGKGWENSAGTLITQNFEAEMKADLEDEPVDASNTYTPYQDASTLVMMIALALTQGGTFAASYEIVKERPIFQRERAVNLSVWSYVLSKMVVLSLFAIFQVIGVMIMVGLFVDLDVPGILFEDFSILEIFITLYLAILASIGLGLFISAMVPTTDVVLYVILAQLFLQIVLSGTLFPMPSNPASYATPGYWATDALSSIADLPRLDKEGLSCVKKEMPDFDNINMTTGEPGKKLEVICDEAATNAESLESYEHSVEHLFVTWFAMGAHVVGWVLLTIFVQSRKKSGKD